MNKVIKGVKGYMDTAAPVPVRVSDRLNFFGTRRVAPGIRHGCEESNQGEMYASQRSADADLPRMWRLTGDG